MTKLPLWLTVPPMTRSPTVFATGIDSPVTIDSSMALRPSTISPSTGDLVAGPHAQAVADRDPFERDVLVGPVGPNAASGLRRKVEKRADSAAGPFARAQLQHLAEQHEHGNDRRRLEIDTATAPFALRKASGKTLGANVAITL